MKLVLKLVAIATFLIPLSAQAALNIPLTVNLSETVTVTGTPRIAVDVGGTTRYATYTSGTGSNALTFTLSPQGGDVDLDGVTVSSPIDLNGGTIKDAKGNNANLTFTPPSTANVKVNYPSFGMDFVYDSDGRYSMNGTAYNDLTSFLTAAGGSFIRASVGTYFDPSGNIQTAASGVPRFDYDPVTHAAKGLLIEESRSNLLTYSMTMNTAPWNLARSSVTLGATTSPDGTTNAIKFYNNGTSGSVYAGYWRTYTANQTYTYSIFAKKAEITSIVIPISTVAGWLADGSITFNLNTGTASVTGTGISSYSITPLPNGWYRCAITATFGTTDTYGQYPVTMLSTNPMDSVSGVYLWGAQLEQGAFPTSYIPTTTATVTRASDRLTFPTAAWYNGSEGAMALQGAIPNAGASIRRFATLSDGTINNTIQLANAASNTAAYMEVRDTLAIQASMTAGSFTAGSYVKNGLAYKANDFALTSNGSAITSDSSGSVPTINLLTLGSHNAGGNYINGGLKSFKYYPLRVTNSQLQLLTQ